jgi:hypothetical protein
MYVCPWRAQEAVDTGQMPHLVKVSHFYTLSILLCKMPSRDALCVGDKKNDVHSTNVGAIFAFAYSVGLSLRNCVMHF